MSIGGVRIELSERESPVFGDTEFGTVGRYERLHGTVFGELDPTHPLKIADLGMLELMAELGDGTWNRPLDLHQVS